MQAIDALNRILGLAALGAEASLDNTSEEEANDIQLALAIGQQVLNASVPMTRYRVAVELDPSQPRVKGDEKNAYRPFPGSEFIICSVNIDGILSGLLALTLAHCNCRISIYEIMPGGIAVMVMGYQGPTKSANYKAFLRSIRMIDGPVQGAS